MKGAKLLSSLPRGTHGQRHDAKGVSQAHSPALQNLFAGFAPFVVFQNPLEEISVDLCAGDSSVVKKDPLRHRCGSDLLRQGLPNYGQISLFMKYPG